MLSLHRVGRSLLLAGAMLLLALSGLTVGTRSAFASGSGAYLYTHTATSANTAGDYTLLDNPVSNGDPNALVFVTANWNPGGVYSGFDGHQVGVWYDAAAAKWGVFNEDLANMPVGASFNVYALPGSISNTVFVQTTTAANISGDLTFINSPALNGNPSANLLVTQNWNPGGSGAAYNNHAVGVWYDSWVGEWTIYNDDGNTMSSGVSFNVVNMTGVTNALTQVATTTNTSGDSTCINSSAANGNPNELLFITHVYSGYFSDVSAVWYNSSLSEWCVFDGAFKTMPTGATFFVTPTQKYP